MSTAISNNNKLPHDLPQLQNLIKRDPESYTEEFLRQYENYTSTKFLFEQDPLTYNANLNDLINFMSQVTQCYQEKLKSFPNELIQMLNHHATINPSIRMCIIKNLIMLKNKKLFDQGKLIEIFFDLLHAQDKTLRTFIRENIITDLVNIHTKRKDEKLKKEMQNFLAKMMRNTSNTVAKTALDIMLEMCKKKLWNDERCANIIVERCYASKNNKITVAAIKFFIMKDNDEEESGSESEEEVDHRAVSKAKHQLHIKKSNKSNFKALEKAKLARKKKTNKQKDEEDGSKPFSQIYLIHDPQEVAEKVFRKLQKMNERFEIKLLMIQFLSQLIGIHELYLPNFYSFVKRYLFVQQREVTKIMASVAQSAHSLVPPEDLSPIVRTLADNFVTERYRGEVMAMGLNAITQLCGRNCFAMDEDLLHDLVQFRSHKDKAVSLAAVNLNHLFQKLNPDMLPRKFKTSKSEFQAENEKQEFGKLNAKSCIPGAEILDFVKDAPVQIDDSVSDWSDISDDEEGGDENKANQTKCGAIKNKRKKNKLQITKAEEEALKLTPTERNDRAFEIASTRCLTDDDFKIIARLQDTKKIQRYSASRKSSNKKGNKRTIEDVEEGGDIVNLSSIEMVSKKRRHDKEARMETVLEGRENREKFGSRKGRMNEFASKTNREYIKSKNYTMVKHKIAGNKRMKSFRERQLSLKKSMLRAYK